MNSWILKYFFTVSLHLLFKVLNLIFFPTYIQHALWQEKAQMRLDSLITLLADCGIPLLLSWSNSPKELQKGEWWINLIIASCVVKYQLFYCPHAFGCSELHLFNPEWKLLPLYIFSLQTLCQRSDADWSPWVGSKWRLSSWSRGFKAFFIPWSPSDTNQQG